MTFSSQVLAKSKPTNVIALYSFLILIASAGHAAGIYWQRTVGDPCPSSDAVSCGELGHFTFSDSPFGVAPSSAPECNPTETHSGSVSHVGLYSNDAVLTDLSIPCAGGSCLESRPEGADILVVDWANTHGWSVAGLIDQVSSLPIGLFDLESSHLGLAYDGVGDPEVIAQLCRIAELPEAQLPAIVNMSFGRRVVPSCSRSNPASLECEIEKLLLHLNKGLGILFVGAAGNHGNMIFPAYSDSVLSAGSLEIAALRHRSVVTPASQTPPNTNILVPGYGIFLPKGPGMWPAPAGSSYAAALATGWIAETLSRQADSERAPIAFTSHSIIQPDHRFDGFALTHNGLPIANSNITEASEIVKRSLGWRSEVCLDPKTTSRHILSIAPMNTSLPTHTFDDIQSLASHPCPDSLPCVPCHDLPGGGDEDPLNVTPQNHRHGNGFAKGLVETAVPVPVPQSQGLLIDLSRSEGIDTELYHLEGIYLQVGSTTYGFSDSTNSRFLDEISSREVTSLEILDPPAGFATKHTSLVFHLRVSSQVAVIGDMELTLSIPIAIHQH